MAKYTEKFRQDAVHLYSTLLREGTVQVDSDLFLNNVRELVAFLEISSYSLYKWAEKLGGENIVEIVDKIEEAENLDFFEGTEIPEVTFISDEFFNGRYYAWMGARLNIPYASRNAKETNMLKIGLELIKRSGLVDCDKVKRAMGGK